MNSRVLVFPVAVAVAAIAALDGCSWEPFAGPLPPARICRDDTTKVYFAFNGQIVDSTITIIREPSYGRCVEPKAA